MVSVIGAPPQRFDRATVILLVALFIVTACGISGIVLTIVICSSNSPSIVVVNERLAHINVQFQRRPIDKIWRQKF